MKWMIGVVVVAGLLLAAAYGYQALVYNPGVVNALTLEPDGKVAARVLTITLPNGRTLPANYLREGNSVFIGVDGLWWREFRGAGAPVTLLIRGETLTGHAHAVEDDAAYTRDVFARLRPTAPTWLPGRMKGVLVVVELDPVSS